MTPQYDAESMYSTLKKVLCKWSKSPSVVSNVLSKTQAVAAIHKSFLLILRAEPLNVIVG